MHYFPLILTMWGALRLEYRIKAAQGINRLVTTHPPKHCNNNLMPSPYNTKYHPTPPPIYSHPQYRLQVVRLGWVVVGLHHRREISAMQISS
jgi:hypothetical protein